MPIRGADGRGTAPAPRATPPCSHGPASPASGPGAPSGVGEHEHARPRRSGAQMRHRRSGEGWDRGRSVARPRRACPTARRPPAVATASFCTLSPTFGDSPVGGEHSGDRCRSPCRAVRRRCESAAARPPCARSRAMPAQRAIDCSEDVAVVSGEQLVAAVTAEADGQLLASGTASRSAVGSIDGSANGSSQMAGKARDQVEASLS